MIITPNGAWGGDGSLGCGIGYGYLHRIPMDHPPMPPLSEPITTKKHIPAHVSQSNQPPTPSKEVVQPVGQPDEAEAAPVMPMVPAMMSSPVVGTMPPPPTTSAR